MALSGAGLRWASSLPRSDRRRRRRSASALDDVRLLPGRVRVPGRRSPRREPSAAQRRTAGSCSSSLDRRRAGSGRVVRRSPLRAPAGAPRRRGGRVARDLARADRRSSASVLFLRCCSHGAPADRRWRPVVWLAGIVLARYGGVADARRRRSRRGVVAPPRPVRGPAGGRLQRLRHLGGVRRPDRARGLVVRFRRSRGDERLQLKWLVCVAAVDDVLLRGALAVSPFSETLSDISWGIGILGFLGLPVVTGIAILATGCTRSTSSSIARCSTARYRRASSPPMPR